MAIDIRGLAPLLSVFDMRTSLRFYRDVLGFELISDSGQGENSGWCLLRLNGVEIMLNTAYDDDERPAVPDRTAAHGDTAFYFGCRDLDEAYQYLRSKGVNVKEPKVAPYGMRQLYVTDPDGYNLCFQWSATEQMEDQ
ncbi:MAG TPA: VOC family protein [Terriglobales bacterium]|nr:VOC family protein [Terriglobales bacterium]